jgi:hypothetical protein
MTCRLAAACLFGSFAGATLAQTCGSPLPLPPGGMVETTSCGQMFDGGAVSGPGAVLDFTLEHPSSVTFGVFASQFTPSVCVLPAGDCGTGTCIATGDAGRPASVDPLPEGSYWVIVTASPFDAPGACGLFELVNDTQAADTILADGFD